MPWMALSVAVGQDQADVVGELLESCGAVAVTLSGAGEEVLLEPLPGERPLWQQIRLEALFEPDLDIGLLRTALIPTGARLVDASFVGEEDWQERWRAYAVRACFAGRLWLLPRDEPLGADQTGDDEALVLRLDPGLAFGSGSHPTTRLCLEGLAAAPPVGQRVLDFGCGSGILALAACLLGARHVVAVDHDPQALLATRDNAAYNGIGDGQLSVLSPEQWSRQTERQFDLVVANILANPLVELAPLLIEQLAPGGRLMLSGLLAEQESAIRDAYRQVHFAAPAREAEWIRLDGVRH